MTEEERAAYIRGKIVATCEAILRGELGALAGARILCDLRFAVGPEIPPATFFRPDEDFDAFEAIESETDHLPIGWERSNWSAEALAEKEPEGARAEAWAKEVAFPACEKLMERFGTLEERLRMARILEPYS